MDGVTLFTKPEEDNVPTPKHRNIREYFIVCAVCCVKGRERENMYLSLDI
jgi:hypothetical protein